MGYNRNTDPIEMIQERMLNAMMASSEVNPAVDFASDAFDIERETGHEFSRVELSQAWHAAADYMVDSHVQNEYDTPYESNSRAYILDGMSPADYRASRIAQWEAMRPSTRRIAKLSQLLLW